MIAILDSVKSRARSLVLTAFALATVLVSACGGGSGGGGSIPQAAPQPTATTSSGVPVPATSATPSIIPSSSAPPPTGPTPATTSTPASGIPMHIATWAYDEYGGQGDSASPALARTYLTYAEGGYLNTKALSDCGGSNACYSVFYFDPNFVYPLDACAPPYVTNLMNQATESWFMHLSGFTDSAHRLLGHRKLKCGSTTVAAPVLAVNHFNPGVRAYINSYLNSVADNWDYILSDETSSTVVSQFYGPGAGMCQNNPNFHLCYATQEYPNDEAVVQAHDELFSSLTHGNGSPWKLFWNGINYGEQTDITMLKGSQNLHGGACEDCVVSLGKFEPANYSGVLDTMAKFNAIPNASFIELNVGNAPAGSADQIAARTISVAMAWLGYSPGHTIVWPDFEYGSKDLAVWPEYNIVPTQPLETMNTTHTELEVVPGVYRREFRSCYNFGVPIGQCAAIANGTSASVTVSGSWLQLSYGHVIQPVGGDIQSGGRVDLASTPFVPSAVTLAPGHGILLVR